EQLVVSIAAGVRLGQIEAVFGHGQPVVRAMPNTPALIGEGAAALCAGRWADAGHMAAAQALLDAVGVTVQVEDERLLDVVTGLSGSGPAFIFLAIEALADGAVAEGLDRATAQRLAAQTVLGAAKLVLESEEHPARLRDRVTSPGGTTAAGLEVLEERAVRSALAAAVRSAARRARELAQQD